MNDFYLKLASEASMPSVLSTFYDEDGEFVSNTADYSIDVVGVLHEATGVTITNDDGMEYPEMAALDGWHVNLYLVMLCVMLLGLLMYHTVLHLTHLSVGGSDGKADNTLPYCRDSRLSWVELKADT